MRQEIIDRILEAPLAEHPWGPLFPALRSIATGMQCMIRFRPAGSARPSIIRTSADDVPGGPADVYRNVYQFLDPVRYDSMSPGVLYAFEDMIDIRKLSASLYYRAFCEPLGLRHAFFCYLGQFDGTDVWLNGARESSFSPGERKELQSALPFVSHAARYYCRAEFLRIQKDILSDATARLGVGVVMLDARGHIIQANSEAEAIFASGSPVSRAGGRLHLPPAASRALLETLQEARSGQAAHPRLLTVSDTGRIYFLFRATAGPADLPGHGPAAVVYLRRDRPVLSAEAMQSVQTHFGLTRSEARLVMLLVSGHSLAEAAQILSHTPATIRTYCNRALEKAGVSRQAELVSLVLGSLAPLA